MADKKLLKVTDSEYLSVMTLNKVLSDLVSQGKGSYAITIDTNSKEFMPNVVYINDEKQEILIGVIS